MKFTLIENSLDSLNEATNYYLTAQEKNENKQYKYVILLLSHSIELLLKEILRREHYSLIFEEIDKIDLNYDKTVNIKTSMKRIEKICKQELGLHKEIINNLSNVRNRIQHSEFELNKELIDTYLSQGYYTVKYLFFNILIEKFKDYEDYILKENFDELNKISCVVEEHKKIAKKSIEDLNAKKVLLEYAKDRHFELPCPNCSHTFLYHSENVIKCSYCLTEFNSMKELVLLDESEIISSYIKRQSGRRKEISELRVIVCPSCWGDLLIFDEKIEKWFCCECGDNFYSKYCEECGEYYPDEESYFCELTRYNATDDETEIIEVCRFCPKENEEKYYDCGWYQ